MTQPRGPLFQVVAFGIVLMFLAVLFAPTSRSAYGVVEGVSSTLAGWGAPGWLSSEHLWEPFFNVLLFVPLGVLAAILLSTWPRERLVLVGLLVSVAAELTQALLLPARHGSLLDVVTNTAGMAVGVLATRAVTVARHRRGQ